jgi:hypothetical protein
VGSIGVLGGFDKRTFREGRVHLRQLLSSATACVRPNWIKSLVARIRQVQLSKSTGQWHGTQVSLRGRRTRSLARGLLRSRLGSDMTRQPPKSPTRGEIACAS